MAKNYVTNVKLSAEKALSLLFVRRQSISNDKARIHMRISGINIPDEKRVDIALTYLYGIGRSNVVEVLKKANLDGAIRVKDLSEDEQKRVQKAVESYKIEGDLRSEIGADIRRLKEINSYRGPRHARGLPVRGQRTK